MLDSFKFLKNFKDNLSLVLCIFLSFLLMSQSGKESFNNFRLKSLDFFSFLYSPFNWIDNQSFLIKKLEVLSQENLKLNLELNLLKNQDSENARLREFVQLKEKVLINFIGADILSRGLSSNLTSVLVDRGSIDGVKVNFPVMSSKGIIGKVISVDTDVSEVQLISDVNFRMSVKILPNEAEGILRWTNDDFCEVFEVKRTSEVKIQDIVVSSNLSQFFPENLPVGEVIGIYDSTDKSSKVLKIKLFSDLSRINQVFIGLQNK